MRRRSHRTVDLVLKWMYGVEPHGLTAVAPPPDFGVTRRSVPSFAKAMEGYPRRIHPRVNTRGSLRRRVAVLHDQVMEFT